MYALKRESKQKFTEWTQVHQAFVERDILLKIQCSSVVSFCATFQTQVYFISIKNTL